MDTLYTAKEAAVRLRLSKATIKRYIKKGLLERIVINKRGDIRITEKMIEAFLDKQK